MSLGFLDFFADAVRAAPAPQGVAGFKLHIEDMAVSYQAEIGGNGEKGRIGPVPQLHMATPRVSIQTADFNLADEVLALRASDPRVGAVCSFVGTVRDRNDGSSVSTLELEHYPGMTEKAIEAMIDEAQQRFAIFSARVIHRVGVLQPMDQIVLVAVTSAHRGESFRACEFLMDYLKTHAPFWKKELTPEGARWVDARSSDDATVQRWGITTRNAG